MNDVVLRPGRQSVPDGGGICELKQDVSNISASPKSIYQALNTKWKLFNVNLQGPPLQLARTLWVVDK